MTSGASSNLSSGSASGLTGWRLLLGIILGSLLLRLCCGGLLDLLPEEAYYWCYAQHPDTGYLDHPPMVAWLIWLSTKLFHDHELAVRLPSLLCWLTTAFFIHGLTRRFYGRAAAWASVGLLACLPIYVCVGLFMTPDAPLYACWSGALYFLARALVENRPRAWLGVGVCLGLGMDSKYTIALLVPAILLFVLLPLRRRIWSILARPELWLGALVAVAFFLPVILWNARHDWASFSFQGGRRWSGGIQFGLHALVGSWLLLVTPPGLAAVAVCLMPRRVLARCHDWIRRKAPEKFRAGLTQTLCLEPSPLHDWITRTDPDGLKLAFSRIFCLVPLAVFVVNSLRNMPKLNWSGPVWLAVLPMIAGALTMRPEPGPVTRPVWCLRPGLWRPLATGLILFYIVAFIYVSLGMPGMTLMTQKTQPLVTGWRELGHEINKVEAAAEEKSGREVLVVGMDKYFITSQVAFYGSAADRNDVIGRHLFGLNSLMWKFWKEPREAAGFDILLVAFKRSVLEAPNLGGFFATLEPVETRDIPGSYGSLGRFYYRVGHGYKPVPVLVTDLATPEP